MNFTKAEPAPIEMNDALRKFIEGMSVSVDVSTGDHDAGNRYFGTVTEVMDCHEDKHGVILLVQEPEPNFKTAPADAETALLKVLSAVQRYLPPDGISIDAAMSEIIEAVDPWPIGNSISAQRAQQEGGA